MTKTNIIHRMFLTWKLWRAIRFPERRNPVFNYARNRTITTRKTKHFWIKIFFAIIVPASILILFFPVATLSLIALAIAGLTLCLVLFNGTVYGLKISRGIALSIAQMQMNTQLSLIQLSSQGLSGTLWFMASGTIHKNNHLRQIYRIVQRTGMLVLSLLLIATGILLVNTNSSNEYVQQAQFNVLKDTINIALMIGFLCLDHVQSIVIATLTGILLPAFETDDVRIRFVAPLLYLMMQCSSYLLILIAYRLMQIVLYGLFGQGFVLSISIGVLTIITGFFLRETIMSILMRMILVRYDLSIQEFDVVLL